MSCFLSFDNWRMFASYLTLQGACNLWESIKSTSAGDHLADHNHDPTPQVRMVMPIAPKGRLHSDSGSKANNVFLKRKFAVPWASEQLSLHHDFMKLYCILYFEVSRRKRIVFGHSRKRNSIIDTYIVNTILYISLVL